MPQPTSFSYLLIHNSVNDAIGSVGGLVRRFTASGTLLVGDAVYLSAANTVAKSATAANYVGFVGFVVGGSSLSASIDVDPTVAIGTTAALTATEVYVQTDGITRGIVGATGFTAGTNFSAVPSAATAGRIIPGTTAGQQLGTVTTTQATAGSEVFLKIAHR